jgi:HPt (histidine-containing phosphotransfer) domain-containing protein
MNDALNANDFNTIEISAHMMKGSGQSYGFRKISRIGDEIEKSAQVRNRKKIKQLIQKFENYLGNISYA